MEMDNPQSENMNSTELNQSPFQHFYSLWLHIMCGHLGITVYDKAWPQHECFYLYPFKYKWHFLGIIVFDCYLVNIRDLIKTFKNDNGSKLLLLYIN